MAERRHDKSGAVHPCTMVLLALLGTLATLGVPLLHDRASVAVSGDPTADRKDDLTLVTSVVFLAVFGAMLAASSLVALALRLRRWIVGRRRSPPKLTTT